MNRTTLIGIGAVGIIGIVLAAVAVLGMGTAPTVEAPAAATSPAKAKVSAPDQLEDDWTDEDYALEDIAERTARLRARASEPSGMQEALPSGPSDPVPPAPPVLQDAGMSSVFAEERALLEDNPFADIGPESSLDELGRRVDRVAFGVDELAGEYEQLAASSEASTAVEALNRAALLYDHMSGQIPLFPPTDLPPHEMEAWMRQHEGMIQPLREKAHALRERANALAIPPDAPE